MDLNLNSRICISNSDYLRLSTLFASLPENYQLNLTGLEEELNRADIVADEMLPEDVVTMNSTITYKDLDTGKITTIQLAYPEEAEVEDGRVSVLAPVGSALIGLRVGQSISWPLPDGRTGRLLVMRTIQPVHDPEANRLRA